MTGLRYEFARAAALRGLWSVAIGTFAANTLCTAAVAAFVNSGPQPAGGYGAGEAARLILATTPILLLGCGVLGAILGGMDFRHRLYDLSVLITPDRTRLLAAKLSLVVAAATALALAGIIVGIAALTATGETVAVADLGLVIGQVVRVIAWSLAGALLGIALRSPAAAAVTLAAGALLAEPVLRAAAQSLPAAWWTRIPDYLPFASFDGLVPPAEGAGSAFAIGGGPPVSAAAVATAAYLVVFALAARRSLSADGFSRRDAAVA